MKSSPGPAALPAAASPARDSVINGHGSEAAVNCGSFTELQRVSTSTYVTLEPLPDAHSAADLQTPDSLLSVELQTTNPKNYECVVSSLLH